MRSYFVTFGTNHKHEIKGHLVGSDTVVQIQAKTLKDARTIAHDELHDEYIRILCMKPNMDDYPKGIVYI